MKRASSIFSRVPPELTKNLYLFVPAILKPAKSRNCQILFQFGAAQAAVTVSAVTVHNVLSVNSLFNRVIGKTRRVHTVNGGRNSAVKNNCFPIKKVKQVSYPVPK
jgi:hypothetical protein